MESPCWVSEAWTPDEVTPEPSRIEFKALWDTGATNSVITQNVVDACGLESDGFKEGVHHAFGTEENVPIYFVNFVLLNKVKVQGIPVTVGKMHGVDILIGMDIIGLGDFALTNMDGKTKFSFRIPSIADIDFVAEVNEQKRRVRSQSTYSSTSRRAKRRQKGRSKGKG